MIRPQGRIHRETERFLKFTVVGAIGAVVDFGTFNLLTRLAGVDSIPASVLSFTAAVSSNFMWNRYWTYPDSRTKPLARQATEFLFVNLIGLGIRTPIFAVAREPAIRAASRINLLHIPGMIGSVLDAIPTEALGLNMALALSVLVVLVWNFGVNRIWTYSDVQ